MGSVQWTLLAKQNNTKAGEIDYIKRLYSRSSVSYYYFPAVLPTKVHMCAISLTAVLLCAALTHDPNMFWSPFLLATSRWHVYTPRGQCHRQPWQLLFIAYASYMFSGWEPAVSILYAAQLCWYNCGYSKRDAGFSLQLGQRLAILLLAVKLCVSPLRRLSGVFWHNKTDL